VAILTELGYTAAEAERALQMAKGDVEQAAGILSGDSEPGGMEGAAEQLRKLSMLARNEPARFDEMLRTMPELAKLNAQIPGGLKKALLSGALESHLGSAPAADAPLTPTDESNIQQLIDLGFPAEKAKEAYLACRRNTDMAAEALFSSS
jgi:Holliday junction resolvasome RuvABC DNA-binding subunit